LALIVGNGKYPDADAPLVEPSDDLRALTPVLQKAGFGVVALEDARERDLRAAVETIKTRMNTDEKAFTLSLRPKKITFAPSIVREDGR
jgi:hypothetical protein